MIVDSSAEVVDSKQNDFFLLERENDDGSAGFTVLSQIECLRRNEAFADEKQSLSKKSAANGRGRTHNNPMREGRAPENKSSDVVTLSNREGAGGFSKRREREGGGGR